MLKIKNKKTMDTNKKTLKPEESLQIIEQMIQKMPVRGAGGGVSRPAVIATPQMGAMGKTL